MACGVKCYCHNSGGFFYIVPGSLKLGTRKLGACVSFVVSASVPPNLQARPVDRLTPITML